MKSTPLTRAADAVALAEQALALTSGTIAHNYCHGRESSADLVARWKHEKADLGYARAVHAVEFIKAAQEVAA